MLEVKRKPAAASHGAAAAKARVRDKSPDSETTPAANQDPSRTARAETPIVEKGGKNEARSQSQSAIVPVRPGGAIEQAGFQARVPVMTGEAHYKGVMTVDGLLSGQFGTSNGCLSVRQKSNAACRSAPELEGEITFKDMLRVNGHIAGTVYSTKGTLIVDAGARIDANIDVAVAVIGGTVNGDIVAHERVELGPAAKISGNIWTRSIIIKNGAIFEGVCKMIEQGRKAS